MEKLSAVVHKPQTGGELFSHLSNGNMEIKYFWAVFLSSLICTKKISLSAVIPENRCNISDLLFGSSLELGS